MSSSQKQKKKTKAPTGRPVSTAAISQPSVEDTTQLTSLSSFSPDGNHFAFLSLAVDKHRLRVYSTASGQSVAEHIVENARVSSMAWSRFNASTGAGGGDTDASSSPNKKKRRKKDAAVAEADASQEEKSSIEVVLLGLSDGTILIFSPSHGRILRTLTHSASSSPILSLTTVNKPDGSSVLWTSSADGTLRFWDTLKNELLGSAKSEDRNPYTFLTQRPSSSLSEDDRIDVLAAHHSIRILSVPIDADLSSTKPTSSTTFTGHASPIRQLQWDVSKPHPTRFISLAETDRFLYIWESPESSSTSSATEGKIVASIPLDSDARSFAFAKNNITDTGAKENQKQTLLTLSASGKLSIFPVPVDISSSKPSKSSSPTKLPALLSRSAIVTSSKATNVSGKIVGAAFISGEEGKVRIARIVGGIKPVFDLVGYLDENGEWLKEVTVQDATSSNVADGVPTLPTQRYTETTGVAVSSGTQLAHDTEMDETGDGALDVDLAELSLGQRLTALSGDAPPADASSSSEDEDEGDAPRKSKGKSSKDSSQITPAPANTLTRTLIQALHSSDTRLLETCLAHSDGALIMSTVRRMPAQLSVPLIQACVERLGRGKRGGLGKGRGGGGASAQRGAGLVRWVRCVLVVHSGFLMTIPDLVARLSSLHSTLTSRLALQDSLLSLSGRLDMVLSQIELRSSAAPAPLTTTTKRTRGERNKKAKRVVRYVEGESESSEEEEDKMEVEVERDEDEEGSVEDVELGGISDSSLPEMDEDEDDDEDDDEEGEGVFSDEEDEDDDEEGVTMNGFIDDEAEEYSEEDESDEED